MSTSDHEYEKPEVVHVGPFAHPTAESPAAQDPDDDMPGIAPDPSTPDDPDEVPDTGGEPEPDDGPATAGDASS